MQAKAPTMNEARRIAVNVARLRRGFPSKT
jgi:hypothetical protein